jgi:hypothetical protein
MKKLKYPIQTVVQILEEYRSGQNIYAIAGKYKISPATIKNWNGREDVNMIMNPPDLSNQAMFDKILSRLEHLESKVENALNVKQFNRTLTNGHFR